MAKYLDSTGLARFKSKTDAKYQDKLISGTNIKTINNQSLLGSGNIVISGGKTLYFMYEEWEFDDMTGDPWLDGSNLIINYITDDPTAYDEGDDSSDMPVVNAYIIKGNDVALFMYIGDDGVWWFYDFYNRQWHDVMDVFQSGQPTLAARQIINTL